MSQFTAGEVFLMAERAESNAAEFYRAAAKNMVNLHDRDALNELARMEEAHRNLFAAMRAEWLAAKQEAPVYDPYGDVKLYLDALVGMHGGEGSKEMAAKLTGKETLEEIVHRAVDAEAKSILFYVGIKDLVEEPAAREKVAALIEEERKHIITLQNMLAASRQK